MSNSIVFRVARHEDRSAIIELLEDDAIAASRVREDDPAPQYDRAFEAIELDPRSAIIVADDEGTIVGTMQVTYIPGLSRQGIERAQFENVRVRGDRRGHGIGHRMMDWAIAQAATRGCHLVQLTTDKRRTDAQRFYVSMGFQSTHEGMKLRLPRPR